MSKYQEKKPDSCVSPTVPCTRCATFQGPGSGGTPTQPDRGSTEDSTGQGSRGQYRSRLSLFFSANLSGPHISSPTHQPLLDSSNCPCANDSASPSPNPNTLVQLSSDLQVSLELLVVLECCQRVHPAPPTPRAQNKTHKHTALGRGIVLCVPLLCHSQI